MNMNNAEVVKAFFDRKPAESHTGALWTNGTRLFSYQTCVAEFCNDADAVEAARDNVGADLLLLVNETKYSRTTSTKHQSPLRHTLAVYTGGCFTDSEGRIVSIHVLTGVRIGTRYLSDAVRNNNCVW